MFKPPGSPQKTGVVILTTSTPGCPPSSTDSPCPIATTQWQGTQHPPWHSAGQEESPQPYAQLGLLQCQINWRIWKYQHLWQRRRPAFWPLSLIGIHPRSCWRPLPQDSRHFKPTWRSCRNSTNWKTSSVALTQSLVQNITRILPLEVRSPFYDQFTLFQELSATFVKLRCGNFRFYDTKMSL